MLHVYGLLHTTGIPGTSMSAIIKKHEPRYVQLEGRSQSALYSSGQVAGSFTDELQYVGIRPENNPYWRQPNLHSILSVVDELNISVRGFDLEDRREEMCNRFRIDVRRTMEVIRLLDHEVEKTKVKKLNVPYHPYESRINRFAQETVELSDFCVTHPYLCTQEIEDKLASCKQSMSTFMRELDYKLARNISEIGEGIVFIGNGHIEHGFLSEFLDAEFHPL